MKLKFSELHQFQYKKRKIDFLITFFIQISENQTFLERDWN